MAENETSATVCKSVFKNGGSTTTKEAVTKIWTLLINTLEKSKRASFCEKT